MSKKKVKIKIDELLDFFEEGSYEIQYFLDTEKGDFSRRSDLPKSGEKCLRQKI